MNTIHLQSAVEAWDVLRSLPPGDHLISGGEDVNKEVRRACFDYSNHYLSQPGRAHSQRPLSASSHVVENVVVPHVIQVRVLPHQWVDFTPKRSMAAVARHAVLSIAGGAAEYQVKCSRDQLAQLRSCVVGSVPKVTIKATENGCVILPATDSNESSTSRKIRAAVLEFIERGHAEPMHVGGQETYVRNIVSQCSRANGAKVKVSIKDGWMTLHNGSKADPLEDAARSFVHKWIGRGRTLEAIVEAIRRVEAIRIVETKAITHVEEFDYDKPDSGPPTPPEWPQPVDDEELL